MAEGVNDKTVVKNRLNRVIGQLNGISRMLDNDRNCNDIITPLLASRSGIEHLIQEIILGEVSNCSFEKIDDKYLRKQIQLLMKVN